MRLTLLLQLTKTVCLTTADRSRWPFRSIEWNDAVSKIHQYLPSSCHFVLPDLPGVVTPEMKNEFLDAVPKEKGFKQLQLVGIRYNLFPTCKSIQIIY